VTVVAVGSVRSCGVTTMAAGLAMVWPDRARRVLVEADPAGGTLAAAVGLAAEPGMVSLAAAARRQPDPALVFDHAQALPGATPVVAAPAAGEQARSALGMLGPLLGRLGELDGLVLVDCGRLDHAGPGTRIFETADLAVVACRPQLADLNALATFLQPDESGGRRPVVVLVGPGPYPPGEITDTLGLEVAGCLPWDPDAAAGLGTSPPSSRRLTRSALVRALRSLADDLARRLRPEPSIGSDVPAASPVMAEAGR
jgi:MinD-like ATPase involved in chromosome partitioning or flagellar assembly